MRWFDSILGHQITDKMGQLPAAGMKFPNSIGERNKFNSCVVHQRLYCRRLVARTLPVQGGEAGSIPVDSAKLWVIANVGVLGRAVTPLPHGLVGSNPTSPTKF